MIRRALERDESKLNKVQPMRISEKFKKEFFYR